MNKTKVKQIAMTGLSALAFIFVLQSIGNRVPAVKSVTDKALNGI